MTSHLSSSKKVDLFSIALLALNDYDPNSKLTLPYSQKLHLSVLANRFYCLEAEANVAQLKTIHHIHRKIKKQENLHAVMQPVFCSKNIQ